MAGQAKGACDHEGLEIPKVPLPLFDYHLPMLGLGMELPLGFQGFGLGEDLRLMGVGGIGRVPSLFEVSIVPLLPEELNFIP